MENSKKILVGNILVFLVLTGSFLYPGIDFFRGLNSILPFLLFFGITAYLAYFSMELLKIQKISEKKQKEIPETEEEKRITDFYSNISDPNEKYHQLTKKLIKTIKHSLLADSSFFYLYNPVEHYFRLQHYITDLNMELNELIQENDFYNEFRDAVRPRIYSEQELKYFTESHYPFQHSMKSMMLSPVIFGGFIGFVGVDSSKEDSWFEHDLELLTEYTNIISQFISQLENMEKLNRKIDFMQELEDLNLSIKNEHDSNLVYREYVNLVEKYLTYDKLSILTLRSGETKVTVDFIDGVETDFTVGDLLDVKNTIFERIVKSEKFLITDYNNSDIPFRFKPNDMSNLPFKSAVGIVMNITQELQSCMILESFVAGNYSESDFRLLRNISTNMENNTRKSVEYKVVKDLSMIDGLTNLFNHKALKDQLKYEIERSKRYQTNLTYLMIDIDKFKGVNDAHGHLFGDYVLKKIAQIIKASVRKIDIVGRYGGEEFGVILINSEKEKSFLTAERIRSNVENFAFEFDGKKERITISIGLSQFPEHGEDTHNIIANADQAMYRVKDMQGNQVKMYKE
ncbi:MAG: GGDEF domain-containing protein [Candidatus Marinimicrobia bacterium]|nr:GGDEF domain-containing protein [Candidatus Neomarinimicrobiota bacterium]